MENGQQEQAPKPGLRVVTGELHRIRQGKNHNFVARPPAKVPAERRPVRAAVMLALAHQIQRAIEAGEFRDQAEAARRFGFSRSRVTQILDLTLLSPRIQDAVLRMVTVEGAEPLPERALRGLRRYDSWALQEALWAARPALILLPSRQAED